MAIPILVQLWLCIESHTPPPKYHRMDLKHNPYNYLNHQLSVVSTKYPTELSFHGIAV